MADTPLEKSLFLLGSSHHVAPLHVRERFALNKDTSARLYNQLYQIPQVEECLLLNTCNRVEIYGFAHRTKSLQNHLLDCFCTTNTLPQEEFSRYSIWKEGLAVVKHLFEVVSGTDSQMVGETEILGQVKNSFENAQQASYLGPVLNRLFQKSFQAAKWIRTNTDIGRGQVSLGNVATTLALRIFENLNECKILVLGTGEVGQQVVKAFKSRGGHNITVASRDLAHAKKQAQLSEGQALSIAEVPQQLDSFDIIIGASGAAKHILTQKLLKPILNQRTDKPLFLIDLAVPRNFESSIERLSNVYLYNLDDLAKIAQENQKARASELQKCQAVLTEKAEYLWVNLNDAHMASSSSKSPNQEPAVLSPS